MPHSAAPPALPPPAIPPAEVAAAVEAAPPISTPPTDRLALTPAPVALAAPPVSFAPTAPPRLSEILPQEAATTAATLAAAPESSPVEVPNLAPAAPSGVTRPTPSQPTAPDPVRVQAFVPPVPATEPPPLPSPPSEPPAGTPQAEAQAEAQPSAAMPTATPNPTPADPSTHLTRRSPATQPLPIAVDGSEGLTPGLTPPLPASISPAHLTPHSLPPSRPTPQPAPAETAVPAPQFTPTEASRAATCTEQPCADALPFSPPATPSEPPNPATPSLPAPDSTPTPAITTVHLQGNTVLDQADLEAALQPFTGRPLTLAEQQAAADAITQLYLDRGYITSRAILGNPAVQAGVLQVQALEGRIERVDILGVERLSQDYVRSRIELAAGSPVNSARLEDQLRLMRESPLFDNIEASLRAGEALGSSILTVRVDEADPWDAVIGVDNHTSSLVGTEQFNLGVAHQNLTGHGDRLGASYQRTFLGGASTFDLGYSLPVNPMEGTLQLQASFERHRIPVTPSLNIDGEAEEYSLSFRQPLVRTLQEEFALSLAFDYRDGQTFLGNIPFGFGFGPDPTTGISRTSVLRFGQDYVRRDVQGAWAVRSQFNLGLPILGATVNPAPIPDSQFFSWLGQAQRVQRLNDNHLLIVQADLQLSPSSLLPSEQFALGGWASVRGYRQNIRAGDNGLRLSVEDRITLQRNEAGLPTLQLAPFAEIGTVWNAGGNPNPLPAQNFLAGLGLGLLWEPVPNLNLRLDCALPLVDLPNRGNALQEQGVYFQIGYRI